MPIEAVSGWIRGCATRVFRNLAELEHFIGSAEFAGVTKTAAVAERAAAVAG